MWVGSEVTGAGRRPPGSHVAPAGSDHCELRGVLAAVERPVAGGRVRQRGGARATVAPVGPRTQGAGAGRLGVRQPDTVRLEQRQHSRRTDGRHQTEDD